MSNDANDRSETRRHASISQENRRVPSLRTSTVTVSPISSRLEPRGELAGAGMPMVDSALFVPRQYPRDLAGDLAGRRRRVAQQTGKDLSHLGDGQRGSFFPWPSRSRHRNHRATNDKVM